MEDKSKEKRLHYTPFKTFVESSFFSKLSQLKLDKFKLDQTIQSIIGYSTKPDRLSKHSQFPTINLDYSSFEFELEADNNNVINHGWVVNVNTFEEFKATDKQKLLQSWGNKVYESIISGDLSNINQFYMFSFSDLKKYKFYYWIAIPVLQSNWSIIDDTQQDLLEYSHKDPGDLYPFAQIYQDQILLNDFQLEINNSGKFVYIDTCLSVDKKPSILLSNYLYYLAQLGFEFIDLLIFRKINSFQLKLKLTDFSRLNPVISGWERNNQGKLTPKLADLGSLIDPQQLATQAVDLNLKLMKWRISPDIDLDIIKKQRVLLLGAGTLGSYVSRALLGWGITNITFVDNGRVSYSNPVRQPLYKFKDCFSDDRQGEVKAICAANALQEVYPGVNSIGINLHVPMSGHPITSNTHDNFQQLERLFDQHDVVFLLMDSRESRWLPTLLGMAKNKIVINAALGFDSYLVMRHGGDWRDINRLGCYYCNDIVAPNDSLSDRTLDQMCTVTRPGGALLASSLAVELLISILQHPQKQNAPANSTSKFGQVPHQIRGFLNSYTQSKFSTPFYKHCSACSLPVIQAYLDQGWQFVQNCLNDPSYLEEVCGLKEIQQQADLAAEELFHDFQDIEDIDNDWFD